MFFSDAAYRREVKTLDKKITMECNNHNKAWWHLSNQTFTCQIVGYKLEFSMCLNEKKVSEVRARKGRFALATNQLDE